MANVGLDRNKFMNIFGHSKSNYKELENVQIDLRYGTQPFFTMNALIELKSIFETNRKYYILINTKRKNLLLRLSDDNISGWFGHELAHIVEYETMSNYQLLLFIIRYIFDKKFRSSVEKRINAFAISNGFARELFSTFKKFISMQDINLKYRKYIIQNYCPYWKDLKSQRQNLELTNLIMKTF